MAKADLTAQQLRELLHYDPQTGLFSRRTNGVRYAAGAVVGNANRPNDRRIIRIRGSVYKAHRLAWLYVYGEWPTYHIDHLDGNPSNNRIANLRDVPSVVNTQNIRKARSHNRSGLLGAYKSRNKWNARITVDGKSIYLGVFDTAEQAHVAYVSAKRLYHVGCTM